MSSMSKVLILDEIYKAYGKDKAQVNVLTGAKMSLEAGKIYGLIGPSGSGKSTLLHVAGLLDRPGKGSLTVNGQDASRLNDNQRTQLRRKSIGFIYQFHHLLAEFSALENVMMPLLLNGQSRGEAAAAAEKILDQVGLSHRLSHRPAALSGGEQQRVAIARAVVHKPALLLADEPTGNLDPKSSDVVFELLLNLIKEAGTTALIATHNMELADKMQQVFRLEDGKVTTQR